MAPTPSDSADRGIRSATETSGPTRRILFSAASAAGHLIPMVPLADAAADAGHEAAFLSAAAMADLLGERTLLPAGPDIFALLRETEQRTGGGDARHPGDAAVENFAGVRVELTFDEALKQAREFAPDLIVCETVDFVGPLVAAALGVPWASYLISPLPEPLLAAMHERAAAQYASRSLRPTERLALIDPLPGALRSATDPAPAADRIIVRPSAFTGDRHADGPLSLPAGRPRVLITAGTSVQDPNLVSDLVSAVVAADVEAVVTVEPGAVPAHPRVHTIGFVPLARVLPVVDAVVSTAGLGTVLATLAAGRPAVLRPVLADQPWNAQRVAAAGAGIAVEDSAAVTPAIRAILDEPRYRAAAESAASDIAAMPSPATALGELLSALG